MFSGSMSRCCKSLVTVTVVKGKEVMGIKRSMYAHGAFNKKMTYFLSNVTSVF